MLSLEQIIFIAGTVVIVLILVHLFLFVWRLERKNDLKCFLIGDIIFMIFNFLLLFSEIQQVPNLLSSLVIAELTLALVWVELSKRPELKLLSFVPIVHDLETDSIRKFDVLSEPSKLLKIIEAVYSSHQDLKFDKDFSFSVDLSNIGYGEITVHHYSVSVDGKKQPQTKYVASLTTQEITTINLSSLDITSHGFHEVKIEVLGATVKCSKEVWFFISDDFKKLRYIEMSPLKRLLSPLIKSELKDC